MKMLDWILMRYVLFSPLVLKSSCAQVANPLPAVMRHFFIFQYCSTVPVLDPISLKSFSWRCAYNRLTPTWGSFYVSPITVGHPREPEKTRSLFRLGIQVLWIPSFHQKLIDGRFSPPFSNERRLSSEVLLLRRTDPIYPNPFPCAGDLVPPSSI